MVRLATKKKVSWSIDIDITEWLEKIYPNVSDAVNKVLREIKDKNRDILKEIQIVEEEKKKIYKIEEDLLKEFEKIREEGNKEERLKAEEILRKKEQETAYKLMKARVTYNLLISSPLWVDFLIEYDNLGDKSKFEFINIWALKFKKYKDSISFREISDLVYNLEKLRQGDSQ